LASATTAQVAFERGDGSPACHGRPRLSEHKRIGASENRLVRGREGARLRHPALAVLGDHRQRTLREIAEIVGEIGVDALDDRLVAVVAVLPERHFAQEEVAHLIDAVRSTS
jgi:hypothetical protein